MTLGNARRWTNGRKHEPQSLGGLLVVVGVVASLLALSRVAGAQEKAKPTKGVITLNEITIVGRIQKPIASVDVNRIQPKLTLQELRQPFLDRIEKAVMGDPF